MMPSNIKLEDIRKRLLESDAFVTSVIDTIPPMMYFDQEVQEKLIAKKHSTMDTIAAGMKRKFPKHKDISARSKHKRARLDPLHHKVVTEIQQELSAKRKKKPVLPAATVNRAESISQLKERFHSHLEGLRGNRKEQVKSNISKKEQLKNKKKKNKKQQDKSGKTQKGENSGDSAPASKVPKENTKPGPVYNKEGKILYSKFEFGESGEQDSVSKKKQRKKKPKNLKKLLHEAEAKAEEIKTLKIEDKEKAAVVANKDAWRTAIQKAQGVKVKDDPLLLKKSLKKQEKIKKKHTQNWKARTEHTERLKKARQKKRTENIKAKKNEKRDRKIKRAKKKGRILSGL